VSFRLVTTPLQSRVPLPAPRAGGFPAALLEACVAAPGTEPVLERLREPGVLAVTTGQQPALLTGPLYTVHKALSAAALARELETRWARPVVPIFWVAGDDHDFAEANTAAWIDASGRLERGALPARPPDAPMLPLYREALGPAAGELVGRFAGSLPETAFRAPTVAWLERHYRPERSMAAAFGGALAELLAPLGVICIDSTHAAFKRAAAPLLISALECSTELDRLLAVRAGDLASEGRDPGVAVGAGASLVMLEGVAGRDRLVEDGEAFATRRAGERFTLEALRRIAEEDPARLSPNVLLRPVVESALLPTVAYAAGPGELRYLPLAAPVYQRLGVERQTAVPRWSGMVVEARVDRVLEKFALQLEDLAEPPASLERRILRSRLPEDADADLTRLRDTLAEGYDTVARTAAAIDPTLVRSVEGRRDRALEGLTRIEHRFIGHLRRRAEIEMRQLAGARESVYPDGVPQERVLVAPSFLARHGPPLLDATLAAAATWYRSALEARPGPT